MRSLFVIFFINRKLIFFLSWRNLQNRKILKKIFFTPGIVSDISANKVIDICDTSKNRIYINSGTSGFISTKKTNSVSKRQKCYLHFQNLLEISAKFFKILSQIYRILQNFLTLSRKLIQNLIEISFEYKILAWIPSNAYAPPPPPAHHLREFYIFFCQKNKFKI